MKKTRQPRISIAWWLTLFQWILVRYVKVSPMWIETVRAAASKGPILFVLRNRSLIDFLCLRGLMRKHGLPEIGFLSGIAPIVYLPFFRKMLSLVAPKRMAAYRAELHATLDAGGASVVFLRRPAVRGALGSRPTAVDGVNLSVSLQGEMGCPLHALPTVFLWGQSAMRRMPGTMDFLFGSNEYPRVLRAVWLLLIRRSVHDLQVGTPMDIGAIRKERRIGDDALASVVRAGVGRQIEVIRRSKLGALTKPSARVMTEVMNSPRLRTQLFGIAPSQNIPAAEIDAKARKIIRKLAANFHPSIVGIFSRVMTFIWKRIYTGIDIGADDIEKIRATLGEGATLMLPTHKSHVDYLVLSQVMKDNNLMMPHIAAGQNLAFWPLGWLFRSSGAFFIRRRFVDDKFYTAIVTAYVRRLILERYAVEVFIEGGRSRTGKLLRPRTGMLDMALKAMAMTPGCEINVLPIFIGYEHVIEEWAYVAESEGKPKRAENITGLIRTTTVLFKKFGMLYVRVSDPFSVSDLMKTYGLERKHLTSDSTRRSFAMTVAQKTLREINRITLATTSAILSTVLLTNDVPVVGHDDLKKRSRWLVRYLRSVGAPLSATVEGWETASGGDEMLERSARAFLRSGRIAVAKKTPHAYAVPRKQRQALDYYKNNIIHYLVPASIAAEALRNRQESPIDRDGLRTEMSLGITLYRSEFLLDAGVCTDASPGSAVSDALLDGILGQMAEMGIVETEGDAVTVKDEESLRFLANVLRNYHEVYFVALEAVRDRIVHGAPEPISRRVKFLTQKYVAEGRFIKPEGHSILNQKSALSTLKDLHLSRPAAGEQPFANGAFGDRVYAYLKRALCFF